MHWFYRYIYAQVENKLEKYLESLGVSDDIIEYLFSIDEKIAKFLAYHLTKNPQLSLAELKEISTPQGINPYLDSEMRISERHQDKGPQFQKWILVNLRKIRKGLPEVPEKFLPDYSAFISKLNEIGDWYQHENPQISSYSFDRAIEESNNWHMRMSSEGENLIYDPVDPSNIVYGPQWKNPEFNGWTIQRITSKNDLSVEGNKMDHCVGSYYSGVESGNIFIYSLRDSSNEPHATIHIDPANVTFDEGDIRQISGKSNSEPKKIYKEMIGEWIVSSRPHNVPATVDLLYLYENDWTDELDDEIITPKGFRSRRVFGELLDLYDIVDAVLDGKTDDYGRRFSLDIPIDSLIDRVMGIVNNAGYSSSSISPSYYDLDSFANSLFLLSLTSDLGITKSDLPRTDKALQDFVSLESIQEKIKTSNWKNTKDLMESAGDLLDSAQEDVDRYLGYIDYQIQYPDEDDFDSEENFEEALSAYDQQRQEIVDHAILEHSEGFLGKEIYSNYKYFNKIGLVPSLQEIFNKNEQ